MSQTVQYTLTLKDLLTSKIKSADSAVNAFEGTLNRVQGAANSLGSVLGVTFGAAAVGMFVKKVVDAGTSVESARIGLTTLLKDAGEAKKVIDETKQDATTTPFGFESLLAVRKALISAGLDAQTARTDMMALANAIAATGGGNDELSRMAQNLMQIKNVGKATAADIKQFGYAGINIYQALADATGKPIEAVKEMEFSYDTLSLALRAAQAEGGIYANGLQNMMGSTGQKISNIGDNIFNTLNDIFEKFKPIIDFFLNGVNDGLAAVSSWFNGLQVDAQAMTENIKSFFQGVRVFFEPIIAAMKRMWDTVSESVMYLWNVLSQFSAEGGSILNALSSAISWLIDAFTWLYDIVYTSLATVIDVLHTVYVALEKLGIIWIVGKAFEGVWAVLKGIGNGLMWIYENTIKPIFDAIAWVYGAVKEMLGIKEVKVKKTEEGVNKAIDIAMDKGSPVAAPTNVAGNAKGAAMPTATEKPETKGAQGNKAVTITVNIDSLIKDFKIQTTNINEGAAKVREMVAQALMNATNDSQLIAGQ
jgi:tape measure domain-containing protein